MSNEVQEYKNAFKRLFENKDPKSTHIHFDGHTARSRFLRDAWNYGVEQEWLRVETVELEQETFFKGYLTPKGIKHILENGHDIGATDS